MLYKRDIYSKHLTTIKELYILLQHFSQDSCNILNLSITPTQELQLNYIGDWPLDVGTNKCENGVIGPTVAKGPQLKLDATFKSQTLNFHTKMSFQKQLYDESWLIVWYFY